MAAQLSWLEHSVHTRSVVGSNPTAATNFGPVVKRLRHRPFTAVTRVRFSSGSPQELEGKQSPIGWLFLYPFAFFAKAVRLRCNAGIDPYIIFKQNTYTRPVSSVGQSDRLLSGRPGVRITSGTLHVPETYASFPALYVYKEESQ